MPRWAVQYTARNYRASGFNLFFFWNCRNGYTERGTFFFVFLYLSAFVLFSSSMRARREREGREEIVSMFISQIDVRAFDFPTEWILNVLCFCLINVNSCAFPSLR